MNDHCIQREAKEDRLFQILTTVLSLRFGTLWWVQEKLWQSCLPSYDQDSTRVAHPGLYVRKKQSFSSLYEPIPLMHGGSKRPRRTKSFPVKGLTPEEPAKKTFFSPRMILAVPLKAFASRSAAPPHEMNLRLNRHKPSLSLREIKQLNILLQTPSGNGNG